VGLPVVNFGLQAEWLGICSPVQLEQGEMTKDHLESLQARLRAKVAKCEERQTFVLAAEICMYSRDVAAEYSARRLAGIHREAAMQQKIEEELRQAVKTVANFYKSGLSVPEMEKKRLSRYLRNEAARVNRIEGLGRSPFEFLSRIRVQRESLVKLPPRPLPLFIFDAKTGGKVVREAPAAWADLFLRLFLEAEQFLLELEAEAGKFAPSARRQRIQARRIVSQYRRESSVLARKDTSNKELAALRRRLREILERFARYVISGLDEAARASDEREAEAYFRRVPVFAQTIVSDIEALATDAHEVAAGRPVKSENTAPPVWDAAREKRFRELVEKDACLTIQPDERVEFENATKERMAALHPRTPEEHAWERAQHKVTEELIQALRSYSEFPARDNA
jgi:hypothetical protein